MTCTRAAFAVAWFGMIVGFRLATAREWKTPAQNGEILGSETPFKIRTERNLVVVRVVVRDRNGKVVTGLGKNDFRLFDRGELQTITEFSVEPAAAKAGEAPSTVLAPASATPAGEAEPAAAIPDRFVAFFFDDIHLAFEDLARTRDAADRYFSAHLQPGDRAAIFTSSGQSQLDFTNDHGKLHDALSRLRQHPVPTTGSECPNISEYQAYQIAEQHDPTALEIAQADALVECCGGRSPCAQAAVEYLEALSRRILRNTEEASRAVLLSLQQLARRMAILPGQRSAVLLSPGFFTDTQLYEVQEVIDRALRDKVVVSAFDARGLFVDIPGGDATQQAFGDLRMSGAKAQIHSLSLIADAGVLASLASGTGGTYFHNSNDYDAGFLRTGGLPESSYVLVFSPRNLKADGSFHKLKVVLASPAGLTLQARNGYFAPQKAKDAEARQKDEIEDMAFSREEVRELAVDVNTSFFKTDSLNAKLSVMARVDVNSVHFRKERDRNLDDLTLVAALFDGDGNYVTGSRTELEMRLRDATLTRAGQTGVLVKAKLDVKVGRYLMRVVVRDSESARIFALNRTVEIPF